MEHEKLKNLRTAKGFTQKQMAIKIAMEQTTYSRKERGKSPITDEEWNRFAKTLNVPVEEIKDSEILQSKNVNCTFNDNSVGIQYVTIPQEVLETVLKYNKKLEEENTLLKEKLGDNA
jgi:transcriptional regulator with XRE-family HTH domain